MLVLSEFALMLFFVLDGGLLVLGALFTVRNRVVIFVVFEVSFLHGSNMFVSNRLK